MVMDDQTQQISRAQFLIRSAAALLMSVGTILPFSATAADAAPEANVVRVETGALRGANNIDVISFKNIPYAAPPVGDRRWRAPAPAAAWTDVRDASQYGNDCMQNRMGWDKTTSKQPLSEDCLNLNVWAPASATPASKLPVMVWVHGGGFVSGSGTAAVMDGSPLVARGVIVVTFNYRLARFGFFAHPALSAESPDGALANYGFMDQIAALQWIKRNIKAFGGNPDNVTVFGQSAGGDSINNLMLAGPAKGLFQKAIVMSGGGRTVWKSLREDGPSGPSAESIGQAFATSAGIAKGKDDVAALRAIPASKIQGSISLLNPEAKTYTGPILDGKIVTSSVADGFAAGRQAKVPYLVGSTSNELGFLPGIFLKPMSKPLVEKLGDDLDKIVDAYGSRDVFDVSIVSDVTFVEPARYLAATASSAQPTYLYRFSYVTEAKLKGSKGAAHATDIPYIFGNLAATGDKVSDEDRQMVKVLQDYFTAFAKTGVPNVAGQAAWPAYSKKDDKLLEFSDKGAAVAAAATPAVEALTQHFSKH